MEREPYSNSPERSSLQEAHSAMRSALDDEIKIMKSIEDIMNAASSPADASQKMQEGRYAALLQEAMQKSREAFEAWRTAFSSSLS